MGFVSSGQNRGELIFAIGERQFLHDWQSGLKHLLFVQSFYKQDMRQLM